MEIEKRLIIPGLAISHTYTQCAYTPAMLSFRDVCSPLLPWKPALVAVES